MFDNYWKDPEINKIRSHIEKASENFDGLNIIFKEPLFIFSPVKIEYKGRKIDRFRRDVSGNIRINKKNNGYRVDIESLYDTNASFNSESKIYELIRKNQRFLVQFDESGKEYLKNEDVILVTKSFDTDKLNLEEYLKDILYPLKD